MRGSRVPQDRRIAFAHNDPAGLEAVLKRLVEAPGGSRGGTIFLAMESLYSMDGDVARLRDLLDMLDQYVSSERQCVVLDEAHTTGLYGEGGRGFACALREEQRVTVRLMTFGKAVGCSGGTWAAFTLLQLGVSFTRRSCSALLASCPLVPHQLCPATHLLNGTASFDTARARKRLGRAG